MKKLILFFLVGLILSNCGPQKDDLFIKTITKINDGGKESKDSIVTKYTEKYIELKLSPYRSTRWGTIHEIQADYKSTDQYKLKFIKVCDADGNWKFFEDPTAFVNYMAKSGYAIDKEEKHEHSVDYTFKRE